MKVRADSRSCARGLTIKGTYQAKKVDDMLKNTRRDRCARPEEPFGSFMVQRDRTRASAETGNLWVRGVYVSRPWTRQWNPAASWSSIGQRRRLREYVPTSTPSPRRMKV